MKKYAALLLALGLLLSAAGCGGSVRPQGESSQLSTEPAPASSTEPMPASSATALLSGEYLLTAIEDSDVFPYGEAMAKELAEATGASIRVKSAGSSTEAIVQLVGGDSDLAIVSGDMLFYATTGTVQGMFYQTPVSNVKPIASLSPQILQCVSVDPTIQRYADLKGKRVALAPLDTSARMSAEHLLATCGVLPEELVVVELGASETVKALQEGSVDAAFVLSSGPDAEILALSQTKPVTLLTLADEEQAVLIEKYPFYSAYTLDKELYAGTAAGKTIAIPLLLIVRGAMEDAEVYAMTAALWSRQEALEKSTLLGSTLSLETALEGVSAEMLHSGAAQYYQERGATGLQ